MERFLSDAEAGGAIISVGGKRRGNVGNFFTPAVVTDLADSALLMREECFGPILPAVPFGSDEEAFERANAVDAGLAAYAFTGSIARAHAASQQLKAGMVGVNSLDISQPETPFGGTKMSGFGSEGGVEGLRAYLDTKLVTVA
jgi:succinate-semialdehyde dehydrogenase/glutarate-semialdehyde dehydrogenase